MTRLLLVSPHFAEYSLRLADGLAARHDVTLVLEHKQYDRDIAGQPMNGLGRPADVVRIGYRSLADLWRLYSIARRDRPAAIHFQEASGRLKALISLGLMVLMRRRCRIVLTVHDPVPHSGRDTAIARRVGMIRRISRRMADCVLVHGESCRASLEAGGQLDPSRIRVTHHGVLHVPRTDEQRSPNPGEFLIFGRMEHYKGLSVAVAAAKILSKTKIPFTLTIVGAGPEMARLAEEMAEIAEIRAEDRFVPTAELITAVQSAQVVLLPYLDATQSGVLAGALGGERPVIASRTGGLPDVIVDGENGLLVPPGDEEALARAMLRVLTEPGLADRLASGARVTAHGKLDWDRIAEELEPAYTAGTGASPAPPFGMATASRMTRS